METHARYFLIGISSLLVTAVLIVFVLWLGKMHESVAGLAVGGGVQFHGINIGEVRKLSLDPNDPREISVIVRVIASAPIKTDTKAQLSYTGLTGVAVIELFDGTPEAKLLRAADPSSAPKITSVPSSLSQLLNGGSGAVNGAQEVTARAAKLLSDANIERVSRVLDELDKLAININRDYPELRAALADARALEQRLTSASARAESLITQVQRGISASAVHPDGDLFAQANAAIKKAGDAANSLQLLAQTGRRTMKDFDSRSLNAEMLKLLADLGLASANLERVTQHFDQAPIEYLLGSESLPVYTPERAKKP
jgi:phospholipid/cholesterol/gamma-HCH transport system substrate-binding protein